MDASSLANLGVSDPTTQQNILALWAQGAGGSGNNATGAVGNPQQLSGALGGSGGINGGGIGAGTNGFNTGFGVNVGTGQLALNGLSTLGNLWTAWNSEQLANKSFNFNKQLSSDNYTNQAQAYNTNLQDIASSRGAMENQTPAQVAAYTAANNLKTTV